MITFYDAFHGIGGFRHGLEQAGWTCVGGCEIDKYACQAYGVIFNEPCEPTDIRRVIPERLPDFDCFVGGFPCQDLSVAGQRKGFDGDRSVLYFEILRICRVKKPKYILLENVEGLLSHNQGETFEIVLYTLDELGYDMEWQVHNSAAYVPQNRERTFLVASLRGGGTRKIFPFGSENSNVIEVVGRIDIKGDDYIKRVYGTGGVSPALPTMQGGGQEPKVLVTKQNNQLQIRGIATCIDANYYKGLDAHQQRTGVMEKIPCPDDIAKTVRVGGKGSYDGKHTHDLVKVRAILTPDREKKRQNGRRAKEPGEPMFTLTAQDLHGVIIQKGRGYNEGGVHEIAPTITSSRWECNNFVYQEWRIRKLTVLECFRLQSYPDWWYVKLKLFRHPELIASINMSRNDITAQVLEVIQEHDIKEGISDSQMYKMAGNGVTSEVARQIGIRMNGERGHGDQTRWTTSGGNENESSREGVPKLRESYISSRSAGIVEL